MTALRNFISIFTLCLLVILPELTFSRTTSCAERSGSKRSEPVNPSLILSKFKQKRYRLKNLQFRFTISRSKSSPYFAKLKVLYEDQPILGFHFTQPVRDKDYLAVASNPIDDEFRGTGVATVALIMAGKLFYEKYGMIMEAGTGRDLMSASAQKIWDRFVEIGVAHQPIPVYRFLPEALASRFDLFQPFLEKQTSVRYQTEIKYEPYGLDRILEIDGLVFQPIPRN